MLQTNGKKTVDDFEPYSLNTIKTEINSYPVHEYSYKRGLNNFNYVLHIYTDS